MCTVCESTGTKCTICVMTQFFFLFLLFIRSPIIPPCLQNNNNHFGQTYMLHTKLSLFVVRRTSNKNTIYVTRIVWNSVVVVLLYYVRLWWCIFPSAYVQIDKINDIRQIWFDLLNAIVNVASIWMRKRESERGHVTMIFSNFSRFH